MTLIDWYRNFWLVKLLTGWYQKFRNFWVPFRLFIFQLHQIGWNPLWFCFRLKIIVRESCCFYLLLFIFWSYSSLLLKNFGILKFSNHFHVLLLLFRKHSMSKNKKIGCSVWCRDAESEDASRQRKTCGVSKCPKCNFSTNSTRKLNIHIKNKRPSCQKNNFVGDIKHNQQSPNTHTP